MRATTLLNKMLDLPGITVAGVSFPSADPGVMVVDVALRAQRLACPLCDYTTRARYDTRPVPSGWRHLDFGRWRVQVRAGLARLDCPTHGVVVEAVPFARHRSGFTRDSPCPIRHPSQLRNVYRELRVPCEQGQAHAK